MNDFDFKRMIREYEIKARHFKYLKKIKKKRDAHNKKYNETIQHIKELREENYQKERQKLRQKKQKLLITSLDNIKIKSLEKGRSFLDLSNRDNQIRKNILKHIDQQEKERLLYESELKDKCKIYF